MAINLQKGQRISLEKTDGNKLSNICVGLNWGAMEKKGFLGLGVTKIAVDLDASCALYDANKAVTEVIYFGNLGSKDDSVRHSGDDLTGDMAGDDGLDNEIITVNLQGINSSVQYIAFILNSFRGQDFGDIPFASIRIYEGTPTRVNEVFARYDIGHSKDFAGHVSMVMGVFYRKNGEWKFNAIGEATQDKKLAESVANVSKNYL